MSESEQPESGGEALFKGIAKHSLVYALGTFLRRAVSFIMLPIYLRFLTPADYGVMFLVEMTLDFISIIGGAQLALGVFRFYHKTEDEEERKQVVSTSFFLVGLLYSVVGVASFLASGVISEILFGDGSQTLVIQIASANLATSSLMIIPMALARVRDLSKLYVSANIGKLLVAVTLNILFIVVMGMGVLGIFLSSLISNAFVGLILTTWMFRSVGYRVSRRWTRNLLRYGVPLMGMQVATFVATFSDRYFLQALSSTDVVGLYGLAYTFGFIMVVIGFTPVDMVWSPRRFEIARKENRDKLLSRGFVFINVVMLTVGFGIAIYVEDLLRVIADPEFHSASAVVPVILVAYVLQCWASVQDIGILVREQTKYLTLANAISALVAVVGYATLIPPFLEWGAAWATVIAFLTRYVLTYVYSQRLWPVRYDWKPIWVLVAWAVAIGGGSLLLPEMGIVLSVTVRTALVGVYFAGVWLLPVLEPSEKETGKKVALMLWRRVRA